MRLSAEGRAALGTIGNAAVGVGLGMSMLWVAFVISQFASADGNAARSTPALSASPLVGVAATANPVSTTTTPTVAPTSPPPTAAPTDSPASATPSPTATARSFSVEPYTNGGRRYAALSAPVGHVYVAPIAGRVQIQTYQLIDGEVRVGSFVPALPFYPYVTIQSADRRVIFRPGALNTDTEMLIKHGEQAESGAPIFKTIGDGPSSWRTFYDRRVTANVIVSVAALPSGAELDPVAFFTTR